MTFSPSIRKFTLTAHVSFSVGWMGAVAVFLALAITGLFHTNPQTVRSCYIAMEISAWMIIVPASLGSLLTGIVQAAGTPWGLFKHYWIIVKLILTVVCTALLLLHINPVSYMAQAATERILSADELSGLRIRLIADAAVALGVLLLITTVSVYKPWGKTPYGIRKQKNKNVMSQSSQNKRPWGKYILIGFICVFIIFIVMHLMGGGLGHH